MEMGLILFKSLIELELHHLRQVRYHDEFSGQVFVQCHTSLRELKDAEVRGLPHFPHEAHPDADIRTEVSDFLQEPLNSRMGIWFLIVISGTQLAIASSVKKLCRGYLLRWFHQ